MSDNYFTIDDIKERTNLSLDFIRRCLRFFKQELALHTTKGEFNALKFDDNAGIIFDRIMQYKNDGLTLPAIKKKLNLPVKQLPNAYQEDIQTLPNSTNNLIIQSLLTEVRESRTGFIGIQNQLTKAYETIIEKEKVIEVQKWQLKLLTDGRTPEEVKKEHAEKEEELFKLKQQVEELELMKVKEQKRQKILKELQSLEGKWFARKKRQELFTQFQNL